MILNYSKPQTTITEILEVLPPVPDERLNALIVGGNYQLARYTVAAELALMKGTPFITGALNLPYENLAANGVVDTSFAQLYGAGLQATLANYTGVSTDSFLVESLTSPNNIVLQSGSTVSGSSLDAKLEGRSVQVGDLVNVTDVTDSGPTLQRSVVAVLNAITAAKGGTNTPTNNNGLPAPSANNPATHAVGQASLTQPASRTLAIVSDAAWNGMVQGALYNGLYGEKYTITTLETTGTTTAGVTAIRIQSASGIWAGNSILTFSGSSHATGTLALLGGLAITIAVSGQSTLPGANLAAGEVYSFIIYGAYTALAMTGSPADLTITGATSYTGPSNTTYVMTVLTGATTVAGSIVQVTDTAGIDTPQIYTLGSASANALGSFGLTFEFQDGSTFPQVGLRTGDQYFFNAVAAARTGATTVLVLDGPAANMTGWSTVSGHLLQATFVTNYTGLIAAQGNNPPTPQWVAGSANMAVASGLSIYVAARSNGNQWIAANSGIGTLYVSYRALLTPAANEGPTILGSLAAITNFLGTIDQANPLAYGAYWAWMGAQQEQIYVLRVGAETAAGYTTALNQTNTGQYIFYGIVPMSNDPTVQAAIASNVDSSSAPTVKRWRRAYMPTETPGKYEILSTNSDGTNTTATIILGTNGNNRVLLAGTLASFITSNVQPGEEFHYNYSTNAWGVKSWSTAIVQSVLSATELMLVSGPASPVSIASAFTIWAPATTYFQDIYLENKAASFNDRRVCDVWVDSPTTLTNNPGSGLLATAVPQPVMFVAAEIAGLRSVIPPQQGLTRMQLNSVTAAPGMYGRFLPSDLDAIAASGTFIVTQDSQGAPVYIRHQLTTDTSQGSLYYEDSVGTNFDSIAYGVDAICSPFIGVTNATPSTVATLRAAIVAYLSSLLQSPASQVNVGPSLLAYSNLVVAIDPVLKDTINISATLQFPLPLNYINVQFTATVSAA